MVSNWRFAILLAPWAIARTPLRIWGDVLFEPIAAAFMAIGLFAPHAVHLM